MHLFEVMRCTELEPSGKRFRTEAEGRRKVRVLLAKELRKIDYVLCVLIGR